MKTRFIKIDTIVNHRRMNEPYSFTEWFCLDSTWKHLYNQNNAKSIEFRNWCHNHEFANGVCPNLTIDGNVLNDGWGSDICARHCGLIDCDESNESIWCDMMDKALLGLKQEFSLTSKIGELSIVMTPFETIIPDEDSLKAFGPFEMDIRMSIETANN